MSHSTHRKTIINSKTYSILVDHLFFYEIMKLVFTVEVPKESFLYLNLREQLMSAKAKSVFFINSLASRNSK